LRKATKQRTGVGYSTAAKNGQGIYMFQAYLITLFSVVFIGSFMKIPAWNWM
jgi:hypothetical protein